jgi:hypothetical protein
MQHLLLLVKIKTPISIPQWLRTSRNSMTRTKIRGSTTWHNSSQRPYKITCKNIMRWWVQIVWHWTRRGSDSRRMKITWERRRCLGRSRRSDRRPNTVSSRPWGTSNLMRYSRHAFNKVLERWNGNAAHTGIRKLYDCLGRRIEAFQWCLKWTDRVVEADACSRTRGAEAVPGAGDQHPCQALPWDP